MNKERIEQEFGKVVFEFETPHLGWELDQIGWICKNKNGKNIVVLTDHGTPYIAKKNRT